ncbi:MAG: four helix bundle protein [Candidatus Vogelbacteria bacterium]|nr:four helix bundle protein [Candidatus Vogelbacteria bacterium]
MEEKQNKMANIKSFRDLKAWQEAHKFVLLIYNLTKKFPSDEKFCLVPQIRRAVVSVSSNIAEGFGRYSAKDKMHFYNMAQTSKIEVENQLLIAHDLKYIDKNDYLGGIQQADLVGKLLTGIIKSVGSRCSPQP